MIVGHSKGNVGLQVALLNFELELGEKIAHQDALISRPVDVVTFGNPVNLPDMMPIMRSLFRYAGHHLQMKHPETKPYHMPIEKIIPEIFGLPSRPAPPAALPPASASERWAGRRAATRLRSPAWTFDDRRSIGGWT